jgi:[ribosomal protein S18]-alanine N-acetyltransferase
VLVDGGDHRVIGYFLAMQGVDEVHLLNLTVAPADQGRGHGRAMLDALAGWCQQKKLPQLWLEVRASNLRAQAIYRRYGFADVSLRRGYYPAARQQREDACVMNLDLTRSARAESP